MNTVTSKDGSTISYDVRGSGPAVILVGGAMSWRAAPFFQPLADALAERFTVYNYDRRGRGDSTEATPYEVEREIEDLEALIEAAGGSAYVWGTSSGAGLAVLAAAAGAKITKLSIYEPPYILGAPGHQPPAGALAHAEQLAAEGKRSALISYFMKDVVGAPAIAAVMMRLMPVYGKLKAVAHTLPYDFKVMRDWSLPVQELGRIDVPTQIVGGTKSGDGLIWAVEQTAKAIPGASLVMLPKQSHAVDMKVLAPVVRDFFA